MFARWQDSVSFCVGFILLQTMAVDAVDKKGVRIFWPDLTKTEEQVMTSDDREGAKTIIIVFLLVDLKRLHPSSACVHSRCRCYYCRKRCCRNPSLQLLLLSSSIVVLSVLFPFHHIPRLVHCFVDCWLPLDYRKGDGAVAKG